MIPHLLLRYGKKQEFSHWQKIIIKLKLKMDISELLRSTSVKSYIVSTKIIISTLL